MQDDSTSGPEVDAWELFALAACQPLRGHSGCFVAPQLEAAAVMRALDGYLRPRPDELLLAIVEQPGPTGPSPGCTITSRRVCWPGPGNSPRSARALAFEELPPSVPVSGGLDPKLDLGNGQLLPIQGGESDRPADALAGVLSTIARAKRSGDLAGSTTRDDLNRSRTEIGQVVQQAAALHRAGGAVRSFQAEIQSATPRVVVTPIILGLCLLVFAAMAASGVSAMRPTSPELIAWGGNVGALAALFGESWRLVTSVFLHGGLIHLAINMFVLYRIGPLVERLYGNVGFALLYLGAGIGGAIASAWWHPTVVSVGASGAIFGLIGGLGAFLVSHRASIPPQIVANVRGGVIAFVVYNTLFGLAIPGIDNAAHLGGLAAGFVAGLVLRRPWPVPRPTSGLAGQLFGGLAIAAGLSLLGLAVAEQIKRDPQVIAAIDQDTDDPVRAYQRLIGALAPSIRRFEAIKNDLNALTTRIGQAAELTPEDRAELDALIEQGEENRESLTRVEADDPDLRAIRDALVDAQSDLVRGLRALGRALDDPEDTEQLEGPEGFLHYRDESLRQLERFAEASQAYFRKHGLVEVANPDADAPDSPDADAPPDN